MLEIDIIYSMSIIPLYRCFKKWTEVREEGVPLRTCVCSVVLKSGLQRKGMFNVFNSYKIPS